MLPAKKKIEPLLRDNPSPCKTWTKARYWQFIRSLLRMGWNKYPVKYEVLRERRRPVEGVKHKFEYQCVECKEWFMQKDVQIDHIVPAGSLSEYKDLAGFVERLFCSSEGLQILCKACHNMKTQEERKLAKEIKNASKI